MQLSWLVRLRSFTYSVLLHVTAVILLVVSLDFFSVPVVQPKSNVNIVKAVSVDKKQVEHELQRLKKQDEDKKQAEQKRLAELEKQAQELKKLRTEEEQKLEQTRKKQEEEQKRREEEQKKVAQLEKQKTELEKQRKAEEEKKQQAEEERKKAEAEKKQMEEEKRLAEEKRKQEEEAKRKAEEEKKQQAAEKALQEQLAAEQAEEQKRQDASLLEKIAAGIQRSVERNFNKTGLPENLACTLRVKLLPGGDVVDVSVEKSSGNDIFDRRALTAVQKASPLPVPEDLETFERLNLRDLKFIFTPQDG